MDIIKGIGVANPEEIKSGYAAIEERPLGDPDKYSDDLKLEQLYKCSISPHYFVNSYCQILDAYTREWIYFRLYQCQRYILDVFWKEQYSIHLKTRQVGISTLASAYYLWLMLFESNAFCIMLSRGEREATALLGDRFKPMFWRLPQFMKPLKIVKESQQEIKFSTGNSILSIPTSAGDSYTARAVLIDEAALVYRSRTPLSQVLLNVGPTIDAGGQLALVSKADKSRPNSTYNGIFIDAIQNKNKYFPVFIPWHAVPNRTERFYQEQKAISLSIDGTTDSLLESYPATWEEALQAKESDKRFPVDLINMAYEGAYPLEEAGLDITGLVMFREPEEGELYIITCDPAEGNPHSDPSVAHVYNWETGEQMAYFEAVMDVPIFTSYVAMIADHYKAGVFPERNNHGHSMINLIKSGAYGNVRLLTGPDSTKNIKKFGYFTSQKSKAVGYVELAKLMRDGEIIIHSDETKRQLSDLEGSTLRAPEGAHDDHAICCMLFAAAKKFVVMEVLLGFIRA